jgi:hypothetical protein
MEAPVLITGTFDFALQTMSDSLVSVGLGAGLCDSVTGQVVTDARAKWVVTAFLVGPNNFTEADNERHMGGNDLQDTTKGQGSGLSGEICGRRQRKRGGRQGRGNMEEELIWVFFLSRARLFSIFLANALCCIYIADAMCFL